MIVLGEMLRGLKRDEKATLYSWSTGKSQGKENNCPFFSIPTYGSSTVYLDLSLCEMPLVFAELN